jgi:uncharacterized protein YbcI
MKRQVAGPGRPRKYGEDTKRFQTYLPESVHDRLWEFRDKLNLSFPELIMFLLDQSNVNVLELQAKLKHLEEYVTQLEREKQALLEEREKLLKRIEKLEVELEKARGDRPARSYNEGKLLRQLAENAREGVSWADLCAEVLDLRDEKKMQHLMGLAFNIVMSDKNRYESIFYPKRTAPEFKGWVLKRPKRDGPVLLVDYVLYREDTLKAAKGLAVGEAAAEKVPEVKPLKTGKAAERWLEMFFEVVYREYMSLINQHRGKDAVKYLEEVVPKKLEKVLQDIDPEDWRRAVLAVLEAHEEDWNEAFVSNLRRVVLRALNEFYAKPVEVKANV